MNSRLTKSERKRLERLKSLPCGCCAAPGPSQAHHIEQGKQWLCIPLCPDCHVGPQGIHGDKTRWRIYRQSEMSVLNDTLRRLYRA